MRHCNFGLGGTGRPNLDNALRLQSTPLVTDSERSTKMIPYNFARYFFTDARAVSSVIQCVFGLRVPLQAQRALDGVLNDSKILQHLSTVQLHAAWWKFLRFGAYMVLVKCRRTLQNAIPAIWSSLRRFS